MIVIAYQTLEDLDNIDDIEMSGPFPSTHNKTWLGPGCYLWDTNFEWAMDWGKTAYSDRGKEFVIARCRVDLSKDCFDLFGSIQNRMDLVETIDTMIEFNIINRYDEVLLPEVIQYMKDQGIFNYKSIRAYDTYKKSLKIKFRNDRWEIMNMNQRVQICVITKKEVILQPNRVVYPEKYVI